ncbi:hypothetical protein OSTOST_11091 [Ostertagia ostertagi]
MAAERAAQHRVARRDAGRADGPRAPGRRALHAAAQRGAAGRADAGGDAALRPAGPPQGPDAAGAAGGCEHHLGPPPAAPHPVQRGLQRDQVHRQRRRAREPGDRGRAGAAERAGQRPRHPAGQDRRRVPRLRAAEPDEGSGGARHRAVHRAPGGGAAGARADARVRTQPGHLREPDAAAEPHAAGSSGRWGGGVRGGGGRQARRDRERCRRPRRDGGAPHELGLCREGVQRDAVVLADRDVSEAVEHVARRRAGGVAQRQPDEAAARHEIAEDRAEVGIARAGALEAGARADGDPRPEGRGVEVVGRGVDDAIAAREEALRVDQGLGRGLGGVQQQEELAVLEQRVGEEVAARLGIAGQRVEPHAGPVAAPAAGVGRGAQRDGERRVDDRGRRGGAGGEQRGCGGSLRFATPVPGPASRTRRAAPCPIRGACGG